MSAALVWKAYQVIAAVNTIHTIYSKLRPSERPSPLSEPLSRAELSMGFNFLMSAIILSVVTGDKVKGLVHDVSGFMDLIREKDEKECLAYLQAARLKLGQIYPDVASDSVDLSLEQGTNNPRFRSDDLEQFVIQFETEACKTILHSYYKDVEKAREKSIGALANAMTPEELMRAVCLRFVALKLDALYLHDVSKAAIIAAELAAIQQSLTGHPLIKTIYEQERDRQITSHFDDDQVRQLLAVDGICQEFSQFAVHHRTHLNEACVDSIPCSSIAAFAEAKKTLSQSQVSYWNWHREASVVAFFAMCCFGGLAGFGARALAAGSLRTAVAQVAARSLVAEGVGLLVAGSTSGMSMCVADPIRYTAPAPEDMFDDVALYAAYHGNTPALQVFVRDPLLTQVLTSKVLALAVLKGHTDASLLVIKNHAQRKEFKFYEPLSKPVLLADWTSSSVPLRACENTKYCMRPARRLILSQLGHAPYRKLLRMATT